MSFSYNIIFAIKALPKQPNYKSDEQFGYEAPSKKNKTINLFLRNCSEQIQECNFWPEVWHRHVDRRQCSCQEQICSEMGQIRYIGRSSKQQYLRIHQAK
jgi:hypothetical protein